MTADVEVGSDGNGVIVCQGGRFGGFTFFINKGRPTFTYNYLGLEKFEVAVVERPIARQTHQSFTASNPMAVSARAERGR